MINGVPRNGHQSREIGGAVADRMWLLLLDKLTAGRDRA